MPVDIVKSVPKPPAWCQRQDAELWRSTCRILIRREHLTAGDMLCVEGFVLAWSNVHAARTAGELSAVNRFLITAKTYARELGLTPGSRDRVPITGAMIQPAADPMADDLERFKAGDPSTLPIRKVSV